VIEVFGYDAKDLSRLSSEGGGGLRDWLTLRCEEDRDGLLENEKVRNLQRSDRGRDLPFSCGFYPSCTNAKW
jgi:hypothetical protein